MEENEEEELVKERSVSAPSTPTSNSSRLIFRNRKEHRVSFPEDDLIVSGYFEAPNPFEWLAVPQTVVDAYKAACDKQGIIPIPSLLNQLKRFSTSTLREYDLSLQGEKLDWKQCEALEEVFKRIQFHTLDLEACNLDCNGASAIFDMIEYYESCTHLNISNNTNIDILGWQACCRMMKKTTSLQNLHLRNSGLNEQILLILGRALRIGSHLVSLHLQNSGISGRALVILVAALKLNTSLKELYLGDNQLSQSDGIQIGNLLRTNSCLELLDLRDNHLQDIGIGHICEGLSHQLNTNGGLRTLILSNNQITSKGMYHIAEALPLCRTLRCLNLNHNNLTNEGISRLKEGLISSKTVKYLGLRNVKITCEGVVAIAEYIAANYTISRIDLRDNNIQMAGLMALSLAMKNSESVIKLDIGEIALTCDNFDNENKLKFKQEIDERCRKNAIAVDEQPFVQGLDSPQNTYSLQSLNGVLKVYNRPFAENFNNNNNNNNNKIGISGNNENIQYLSHSPTNRFKVSRVFLEKEDESSSEKSDNSFQNHCQNGYMQQEITHRSPKKPDIVRSCSLGSWDSRFSEREIRTTGRFSVSPAETHMDKYCKPNSEKEADNVNEHDTQNKQLNNGSKVINEPSLQQKTSITIQTNTVDNGDDDNQNLGEEKKDELADLPKSIPKIRKTSFLLAEPPLCVQRSPSRRMSTPAISPFKPQTTPRPRVLSCKSPCLDSLDLKSSLPISPTFFARKFEFPDPMMLRLPSEVEEVILKMTDFDD